MTKYISIILSALLFAAAPLVAQVQNHALHLDAESSIDCGQMPQLDGLDDFSVQMWINPDKWSEGAVLFSRGEDFKAVLGIPGKIDFTIGGSSISATSDELAAGQWSQLTLLCLNGSATVRVNNKRAANGAIDAIPVSDANFIIGGEGYEGRIDEIRLWKDIPSPEFEYYTFNTINKWMPDYTNLLAYYKMDQELCEHLVDYTAIETEKDFNNHGILAGGAKKVPVTDNDRMPYLLNSAYTANERFFDRVIPRDQYLLSNDIIILGIESSESGHLRYVNQCNHANLAGDARQLDEYEGRNGVMSFSGEGYLEAPESTMESNNNYAFETWLYIDEWTDGACLFKKETDNGLQGFSVSLGKTNVSGEEPMDALVVRVNGNNWRIPGKLTTGRWHHIAVCYKGGNNANDVFYFCIDGIGVTPRLKYHDGGTDGIPAGNEECKAYFGQNFKGKLDETAIWKMSFTPGEIKSHMNGLPMVTLDHQVTAQTLMNSDTYYTYDNPDEPGFDYYSQDNWLKIMKSAFNGYRGARFYVSVKTPSGYNDSNLNRLISDAKWRENFAADCARLVKPYDGIELDLEWVYNWSSYGFLAKAIRNALPEGKAFRVSTHNVTYAFPLDKMDYVDGFTFQQYGPQKKHFFYSSFEDYCNDFIKYGYPRNKILTSYSTTTSNGSNGSPIKGVKDGFFTENYEPNGESEYRTFGNEDYWFTGPLQTYKRAKFTRDNNLAGIFYWDMGNDSWDRNEDGTYTMSKWNLARWCSYALNSNVDRLVTEVEVRHYSGVGNVTAAARTPSKVHISPSPAESTIKVSIDGDVVEAISIYNMDGRCVQTCANGDTADVSALAPGVYPVRVVSGSGCVLSSKLIKK